MKSKTGISNKVIQDVTDGLHTNSHKFKCPKRHSPRAPAFDNVVSLKKHILRNHQDTQNIPPTFSEVFVVLEKLDFALKNKISISTIPEIKLWRMEVL